MKKSIHNRTLGGLLDCASGVSPLSGNIQAIQSGDFHAAPFYPDDVPEAAEPFSSSNNIVAERIRVSVSNAIGLRKTIFRPFSLGVATLDSEPGLEAAPVAFVWKEISEIAQWHSMDRLIEFGNAKNKKLYCVFKDLNLHYDVAQIDASLHMRPIVLDIELEISTAGNPFSGRS